MSTTLFPGFAARAGLASDASLGQVVAAAQAMPYGRPVSRTPEGAVAAWRGTCSTKHAPRRSAVGRRASMPLACGEGRDFPAGEDPAADKAALEASHCDPQVREPFIASLARASSLAGARRATR